jgi:putative selenate reductase molybdopterin-binding subunit
MAELAQELQMDGKALIEKNRVREGAMLEILRCLGEGRKGAPALVQSCGLDAALDMGAEMMAWGQKETSGNPDIKTGKSVVIVQQGSGLPGLDQASAVVTLQSDGSFIVHSGGTDLGTGLDTLCVKMASETLCADMEKISIISADTDHTPFDTGAYASSGTFFSGSAALKAAQDLKEKILAAASEILREPVENLQMVYPALVRGTRRTLSFQDIARHVEKGSGQGPLEGQGTFTSENAAFPYGAHFCEVAINTRTGEIKIRKYYALQDCGTPINPELAEGQVYGGVLKAIGHSLWEEMKMNANGKCLNPNLWEYGGPTIGDLPVDFQVKLVVTHDPFGPFGAKSVSELSCNGAAPAIAIAIHDAVGVWLRSWPFTPEKILAGLKKIAKQKNK